MARDETQEEERVRAKAEGFEALSPWLGWVLGPAAWALHQGFGYAMTPMLCRMGELWPYHALTVAAVALCAGGALSSGSALRRSRMVEPERSAERIRMMALVGLMLCAGAFGGIALEYAGSFWIDPCAAVLDA
jgi:hypothetical protein